MSDFKYVPVVEVAEDNFMELWPTLMLAVKTATFVAIDTELSGLGDRKKLNSKELDCRFKAMSHIAKTRSIISLGLSCFRLQKRSSPADQSASLDSAGEDVPGPSETKYMKLDGRTFVVQTFNIMVLCSEEYVVEPVSLKFLIEHGFDFNKQYALGIPYYRGNDRSVKESQTLRQLFQEIVAAEIPVVLHNALVDLVFLYHSFYAELPGSISTFLADLQEVFAGGIFDTKYLSEFKARSSASYLEYVFRKSQRDNHADSIDGEDHVDISYLSYPGECSYVRNLPCALRDTLGTQNVVLCDNYASYGWCQYRNACPQSHDVDLILDHEQLIGKKHKKKRIRNRKKKNINEAGNEGIDSVDGQSGVESMDTNGLNEQSSGTAAEETVMEDINSESETKVNDKSTELTDMQTETKTTEVVHHSKFIERTEGHRAGFDAFMTGFIFAHYIVKYGNNTNIPPKARLVDFGVDELMNKVCFSGKDIPLQIVKSSYVKNSKDHKEKILRIKGAA